MLFLASEHYHVSILSNHELILKQFYRCLKFKFINIGIENLYLCELKFCIFIN